MPSKSKKLKETNQLIHQFMEVAGQDSSTPKSKRGIEQVDSSTPSPEKESTPSAHSPSPSLLQIRQVIREELNACIGDFTSTVSNIKDEVSQLKEEVVVLTANLEKEKSTTRDLSRKIQNFEKYMLRNNLIISNLPDSKNETKLELENKIIQLLRRINVHLPTYAVADVQRLQSSLFNSTNRQVRLTLHHTKDRTLILANKSRMFHTYKIIIEEEFPESVYENRKKLLPIMKAARQNNHFSIVQADTLTIDKTTYTVNNMDTVPKHLMSTTFTNKELTVFYKKTSVFSNHYPSEFIIDDIKYACAEQAYAHAKANFAKDTDTADEIMKTDDPASHKQLMKKIKVQTDAWDNIKCELMEKIVLSKFQQNDDLKQTLINTNGKLLAEGNPHDNFWGVGISIYNKNIWNTKMWKGSNKMGKILMKIRDNLKK